MPFFRRVDGEVKPGEEGKEKLDDIEFKPEKLKEDITKDFDTKFTAFQTVQDEKMKPLLTMAENIEKDRKVREENARKAAEKKDREENAITAEDFLLDPVSAARRVAAESNSGIAKATLMLAARGNIRETLEDKEYYHGAIKGKVDAMIAQQTLENQCRPDVVENCYKVVVFDHNKEIQEGKIKARTSSFNFESSSAGPKGNSSDETTETMTKDEELAAAAMGIKKDDWIKSRKELSFV